MGKLFPCIFDTCYTSVLAKKQIPGMFYYHNLRAIKSHHSKEQDFTGLDIR